MRKSNVGKVLAALMLVLVLALSACGKDDDSANKDKDKGKDDGAKSTENEDGLYSIDDFAKVVENKGEAMDGGEITFGLVSDTPFGGTLNWNFYDGNPDSQILKWFDESLLGMDENYNFTQSGAATFEVDPDNDHIITFTIRDEVNWQDGEPVTAEDWAYSYEIIGHKDYEGSRYNSDFTIIEGMEDYHAGKADHISGIEVLNDKQMRITYKEANPSLLTGGIWTYAMPKHIFKDIPVAKMASSDAVRKNPVGMGPFKVESIVPGEAVTLVRNDDYWRGKPQLDKVTIKVVDPTVVVKELEKGSVDLVSEFPADQYPDNADMSNVQWLGKIDLSYSYVGFKLGTWDAENGVVKPDPNAKMADVELRRAMWYAVDNDLVGKKFYHGLRWGANTLIPPSHPAYHDDDVEAPTFDPDKANQILEDAGYKDVDGDGIREDKDGNELVINFASMSGGDTAEPLANYYIQAWKNVGLNVQLLDGRLQEFESFYDRVGRGGKDDPDVDIYAGAWGVASDVDPSGLYGRDAMYNFPRYASDKNDELLKEGVSEKAFDTEYRQKVYKEWQELMVEEIPVFPTLYRSELNPVNNRIVNYSIADEDAEPYLYQIGVTQDKAEQAK